MFWQGFYKQAAEVTYEEAFGKAPKGEKKETVRIDAREASEDHGPDVLYQFHP